MGSFISHVLPGTLFLRGCACAGCGQPSCASPPTLRRGNSLCNGDHCRYQPLTNCEFCLVAKAALTSDGRSSCSSPTTLPPTPVCRGTTSYHHLLVILIGLCILTSVLGALLPASFPVDVAAGTLIALQGLWFYQTAFSLFGPMLPDGCERNAKGDQVNCGSRAAEERAEQLANFQLFGAVFLAFIYVLGCYAVAAARYGHPDLVAMHGDHVAAQECGGVGGGGGRAEECIV